MKECAASNTSVLADERSVATIDRFSRVAGPAWGAATVPMKARTTKSLPRVGPWERPEGQANKRVATLRNACSVENSPRTKPCCGIVSGCRAATLSVKAAVAREETVKCTERTLGVGGATLLDRADVKAGTVLWTSRGWPKRQRLSNADRRSKEERGRRTRAWAHSSEDGG
jgi:hypothetical protein